MEVFVAAVVFGCAQCCGRLWRLGLVCLAFALFFGFFLQARGAAVVKHVNQYGVEQQIVCVNGDWDEAAEDCKCVSGWTTTVDEDTFALLVMRCSVPPLIVPPNLSADPATAGELPLPAKYIVLVVAVLLVAVACCSCCLLRRCCRREERRERAPQYVDVSPTALQVAAPGPGGFYPGAPAVAFTDPAMFLSVRRSILTAPRVDCGGCACAADYWPGLAASGRRTCCCTCARRAFPAAGPRHSEPHSVFFREEGEGNDAAHG